jgi:hypothetical protein
MPRNYGTFARENAMKKKQLHLKNANELSTKLDQIKALDPNLIFTFGSYQTFENPTALKELARSFPNATVVGCSTAGEFANDGVYDDSLVVTALRLENSTIKVRTTEIKNMDDSFAAGQRLARQFEGNDMKSIFILGTGLDINGSGLIDGIRDILGSKVVITGGLAGDSTRFQKTYTNFNQTISSNQILAVGFYGERFHVSYASRGGWQAFGPVRKVTQSSRNVLLKVDGEPALEIYKKYLGDKSKGLPGSALLYPFALLNDDKATSGLIRTILAVDEGAKSVTFAGDMPEGGWVRLMHTNNAGLVGGAREAAQVTFQGATGPGAQDGLAILVSCVGRKLVMGTDSEEELDAVRETLSPSALLTGFYSFGEICPDQVSGVCKLHNQTMTITYMYES